LADAKRTQKETHQEKIRWKKGGPQAELLLLPHTKSF
jgi:hypothetical protein